MFKIFTTSFEFINPSVSSIDAALGGESCQVENTPDVTVLSDAI